MKRTHVGHGSILNITFCSFSTFLCVFMATHDVCMLRTTQIDASLVLTIRICIITSSKAFQIAAKMLARGLMELTLSFMRTTFDRRMTLHLKVTCGSRSKWLRWQAA